MSDTLPIVGAAVTIERLEQNHSWFMQDHRAIEIQDWAKPNALDMECSQKIFHLKELLDGYQGTMGVHAPYIGMHIGCAERRVREMVTHTFQEMLDIVCEIGATHMVIHSPFLYLGDAHLPHSVVKGLENEIQGVIDTIGPLLDQAASAKCEIVIENIVDKNTEALFALVDAFNSPTSKPALIQGTHTFNTFFISLLQ
jgi:endonuclease IV